MLLKIKHFAVSSRQEFADNLHAILKRHGITVLNINTQKVQGLYHTWFYCESKDMVELEQAEEEFKNTSYEITHWDQ